jgi:hypothetical protein
MASARVLKFAVTGGAHDQVLDELDDAIAWRREHGGTIRRRWRASVHTVSRADFRPAAGTWTRVG